MSSETSSVAGAPAPTATPTPTTASSSSSSSAADRSSAPKPKKGSGGGLLTTIVLVLLVAIAFGVFFASVPTPKPSTPTPTPPTPPTPTPATPATPAPVTSASASPSSSSAAAPAPAPAPASASSASVSSSSSSSSIYRFGGGNDELDPTTTALRYDVPSVIAPSSDLGAWSVLPPMKTARACTAAARIGDNAYVMGGYDVGSNPIASVERYDTVSNQWSYVAPLLYGRFDHAAVTCNNQIYVTGGLIAGLAGGQESATAERYDEATNKWSSLAPMASVRFAHATACYEGQVYVFAGLWDQKTLDTAERYNPATNTWSGLAKASIPRHYVGGLVVGSWFALMGGQTTHPEGSLRVATVDAYDFATDTWTPAPWQLPNPRAQYSAHYDAAHGIIVCGGFYKIHTHANACDVLALTATSHASIIEPSTKALRWRPLPTLPFAGPAGGGI